jgi:ATP-dependent DNA ligase
VVRLLRLPRPGAFASNWAWPFRASRRTYILSVPPPKFTKPCKLIAAKIPLKGEGWLHEPRLDGYRLQVVKDGEALQTGPSAWRAWQKP